MKRILSIALTIVMAFCLSISLFASSGINAYEQALLDVGTAEYETSEPGVYVKISEAYVTGAETYLATEGIDITEAQYTAVMAKVDSLKAFIENNVVVAEGATTLNLEDVNADTYDGILAIFKEIATAADATVSIIDNARYSGRVVLQSNTVDNAKWVIIEGTVKNTAGGFDTTVIIALSAAMVLAVAAVAICLGRKKATQINVNAQ